MHIVVKKNDVPRTHETDDIAFPGIDRGVKNILVCSNNQFFSSKHLRDGKGKYQYLRMILQKKGARSARHKLKKVSGRERRFVSDVNHCLSKELIKSNYHVFVLENLKGITGNMKGKNFNKKLGNLDQGFVITLGSGVEELQQEAW